MSRRSFISCRDRNGILAETCRAVDKFAQRSIPSVCAHAASKPDTDRKRFLAFYCTLQNVRNRQHNVIFLKNFRLIWQKIKIPQIFFCRFELDDHQFCLRCRSGKIFFRFPAAVAASLVPCPFRSVEGTISSGFSAASASLI